MVKPALRTAQLFLGTSLALAPLLGWVSPSSAMVKLEPELPGVAVEGGTELLIAQPVQNSGDTTAFAVTVSEIELEDGHRDRPNPLPFSLGAIAPDKSAILYLSFRVPNLHASRTYELDIEGRYGIANRPDHGAKERDDGDHGREFEIHTRIQVPSFTPGSATSNSNSGITHKSAGPYPTLSPAPPQTENNEFRAPTPLGTPHIVYPLTPFQSPVQNPGGADAGVSFVLNTESNGIINRFPPDPSAVGSGNSSNLVLATGNLYIKYSTDGGKTFTTLSADGSAPNPNYSTVFGDNPDGGYCCDQVVHYIPSIDLMVWLIQTNQVKDASGNVTGHNSLRVAWARPADIVKNFYTAWIWFDVGSDFLGLGNDWLDYPDLSTADGHLYLSVDDVTQGGLVVARISYSDLQLPGGSTVTWEFTDPTKSSLAVSSHLTQNASDTMYWAGHFTNSELQIFYWPENSNQYSWNFSQITGYNCFVPIFFNFCLAIPADYTSKARDGQYWLDPRPKGDAIIGAARVPFLGIVPPGQPTPPDQLWFAWTVGRENTFPQPYIRIAMFDTGFHNVGELSVWNSAYAFAYPALAVNSASGEVAMSLMWGGGGSY